MSNFSTFSTIITDPVKYRMFLLTKLPSAYFAGIRIASISEERSVLTVPQKWFNKNPFRSIYFAILSMTAEISTGVLCMGHLYGRKPAVSMLVVDMNGRFFKKATGKIRFICEDGKKIAQAIEEAVSNTEGSTVTCMSNGLNEQDEIVATFQFTWSFKAKH